jgi:anti-sigma regulatory factor (Ser/Thr protein kinase)
MICGSAADSADRTAPGRLTRLVTGALTGDRTPGPAETSASRSPGDGARRGAGLTSRWPLRDWLELAALPGAVPSARLHARSVVCEWGLALLSADVEQVVSELSANAVTAALAMQQPRPVHLQLLSDGRKILIMAWDANPQPPVLTEAGERDESGRGLILVRAFSERWGFYRTPGTGGKVVWALCGPAGSGTAG